MKVVTIQQPEHAPWIGFFHKMMKVDLYVYLDNVQFKKRYFENRNKVRDGESSTWVTVPVISKNRYLQNISEVEILYEEDWKKSYQGRLLRSLTKAPFKDLIMEWFNRKIMPSEFVKLVDLNIEFINFGRESLKIDTPFVFASSLGVDSYKGKDLILEISKQTNADIYVSGPDGRNYLDTEEFKAAGIGLAYHDFEHPEYPQWQGNFISHMSFLDCLGNMGPVAMRSMLNEIPLPGIN